MAADENRCNVVTHHTQCWADGRGRTGQDLMTDKFKGFMPTVRRLRDDKAAFVVM